MEITSGDMDVHPYTCIDAITTQEFSILTKDFIDKFQGEEQIEPGVEGKSRAYLQIGMLQSRIA